MKLNAFAVAVFVMSTAVCSTGAEPAHNKAVTIPLDQIWTYDMPGTREIRDLAEEAELMLVEPIFESWWLRASRLEFQDMARPGFAVAGSGLTALRATHNVFVEGLPPREELTASEDATIVIFSEPMIRYRVRIQQIEIRDKVVEIEYELEPRLDGGTVANFVLIPLGKLAPGKYRMEMRQLARELTPAEVACGFKPLNKDWSRKFLSKPFTFTITNSTQE